MIKIKPETVSLKPKKARIIPASAIKGIEPVTVSRVTVTRKPVTEKMAAIVASSDAIKQKAYRERKAMGGKSWDEFVAETEAAHG